MPIPSNIYDIIEKLNTVDRNTPRRKLPTGIIHLFKETFRFGDYVIKKTNYHKNGDKFHFLFDNEAHWLENLKGKNIAPDFYGLVKSGKDIALIIEWLPGITLDKLNAFKLMRIDYREITNNMLNTLTQIKGIGLTHKDLRPQNIILTLNNEIRIIDWQLCSTAMERPVGLSKSQVELWDKLLAVAGGVYRQTDLIEHSFDTDKYAVEKIAGELKKKSWWRRLWGN